MLTRWRRPTDAGRMTRAFRAATFDSFGDHRIAMAFTVAGLIAEGETEIVGADAAAVSLPEFFDILSESGATVGRH